MVRGEATSPARAAASGQDAGPLGAALSNLTYPGRQLAWEYKVTVTFIACFLLRANIWAKYLEKLLLLTIFLITEAKLSKPRYHSYKVIRDSNPGLSAESCALRTEHRCPPLALWLVPDTLHVILRQPWEETGPHG